MNQFSNKLTDVLSSCVSCVISCNVSANESKALLDKIFHNVSLQQTSPNLSVCDVLCGFCKEKAYPHKISTDAEVIRIIEEEL